MIEDSDSPKLAKAKKFAVLKRFLLWMVAVFLGLGFLTVFLFAVYLNHEVSLLVPEVRTVSQDEETKFMKRLREFALGDGKGWGAEDYVTIVVRQKLLDRDPKFPTKQIPHYLRVCLLNWSLHLAVRKKWRDACFVENLVIVPGRGRGGVGLKKGSIEIFGASIGDLNGDQVKKLIQIAHQGRNYWLRNTKLAE